MSDLRFKVEVVNGQPVFTPMFVRTPTTECDCPEFACGWSLNGPN